MSPRPRRLAPMLGTVVLVASVASGLVACSSGGGSEGSSTSTTRPVATTTTSPRPAAPTLVTPGAEPRRSLRFALDPGTTTVAITTDLAVVQKQAKGDQTIDPPGVTQEVEYRVGAVDADGATVFFRVTDATIDPTGTTLTGKEVVELTAALKPLVGIRGSGHLAPDGRFDDVTFDLPRTLDDATRAQVDELPGQIGGLTPRLPTEAVGVGGSWTTTDTTAVAGVRSTQTTTYVVTAIEDDVVRYTSTATVTATRQPLSADRLSKLPGVTATLASSKLRATGSGSLRLDRPVSAGTATVTGRQVVELAAAKVATQTLQQDVRVATTCREVP